MPPRPVVTHLVSGDLWAGAEVATFELLRALHRREEIEVRAVVLNEGVLAERLRGEGIAVHLLPERDLGFARLARRVRGLARDADLLHAHRYKEDLLAALAGRPWIATQHGRPEALPRLAALRMRAYRTLDAALKRSAARAIVAVSEALARELAERFGAAKVVCIHNGLDDPWDAVRPPRWRERPRRVGVVARLVPDKAVDLAVRAIAHAPGVELEVLGDGPERGRVEALVGSLGVKDRVRLRGFVPDPLEHMRSWRLLLVPSRHEGNPMSVLEAIALGTPVLAGRLPGVEEIIGSAAGWMLPTRDPAVWGARIRGLIGEEAGGSRAAEEARQRFLARFTAERCAESMTRLYRRIVEGS